MSPFSNEDGMRKWLIEQLKPLLLPSHWMLFLGKNISDIVVFKQDASAPLMLFIEAKYHKSNHGRIPIGGAGGAGYQPEYLLRKPDYLERYLRWIVADEETQKCVLLTNGDVRHYSCNGISVGKHNNIKMSIFTSSQLEQFPLLDAPRHVAGWIMSC
jgi:hypothetical protein